MPTATSTRCSGINIAIIAVCADFWGEEEEVGRLLHRPGGPEHARWVFDYAGKAEYNDESGYRFGAHAFRPGEYVSIADEAGELHTFSVASVTAAT